MRDARTENRAKRLLETYLEPETGKPGHYSLSGEEALFQLLEEGIPALLAMGEVYQTDAFRNLQAAPPKISVGVSVHGSVLDLEVDTGAFPVEELRELLQSLHQKKRYHRLRDGSLLRLDDSLEGLDELNDTLELSGAKLKDGHAGPMEVRPSVPCRRSWCSIQLSMVVFPAFLHMPTMDMVFTPFNISSSCEDI